MSAIPPAVRAAVYERSNWLCEACGSDRGQHVHHRKLRSQGGRHEVENLIHVSLECHERIHYNPTDSYDRGLMVRSTLEPADVPVVMFGTVLA